MDIIFNYFPDLSKNQIEQFSKLGSLYADWNNKINVISRKDIGSLYLRHILHSLSIAKFIEFTKGTLIVDVGTSDSFSIINTMSCLALGYILITSGILELLQKKKHPGSCIFMIIFWGSLVLIFYLLRLYAINQGMV